MDLESFYEQLFFGTVRISISEEGIGSSIGTGFIFETPLECLPGKKVTLLISNKHVFYDTSKNINIEFHKKNGNGGPLIGEKWPLYGTDFSRIYFEHPDEDIDLACLNISGMAEEAYFRVLNEDWILDFSSSDLLPGQEVLFVGYPEDRFDVKNNLPLLRKGYIASMPKLDFNGEDQIVIDAQVWPGSSGSPVFVNMNGRFAFLGVVTQTMIKNQQLQTITSNTGESVQQVLGLGIILKASLLPKLFETVKKSICENL